MSIDAHRWDEKYQSRAASKLPAPDPFLIENLELFQPQQRVVDLASGRGRHALLLATRGCFVVALDCSRIALKYCHDTARSKELTVHPLVADLLEFRFPPASIDAIICFNYLNRELSDNICDSLKPGGHLLMKTFNKNHLLAHPNFNPDYVLASGELAELYARLEVVSLQDDCDDRLQTTSAILATKK